VMFMIKRSVGDFNEPFPTTVTIILLMSSPILTSPQYVFTFFGKKVSSIGVRTCGVGLSSWS
jgi:hypothetical protein